MSDARLWLVALAALPALVIGASFLRVGVERLRRLAVVFAVAMLLAALVIAVSPPLRALSSRRAALSWVPGGEAILRIDARTQTLHRVAGRALVRLLVRHEVAGDDEAVLEVVDA